MVNNTASSLFVEKYYLNGILQWWRFLYNYTIAYLPFAFVYVLIPIVIYAVWKIVCLIKKYFVARDYFSVVFLPLLTLLFIYAMFYFLWAFNYKTRDVSQRLNLKAIELDTTMILHEVFRVNEALSVLRARLGSDTTALAINMRPHDLEHQIRISEQKLLQQWSYKADKLIRVRPLYPKGALLIWSTAGIYNPFSFEGHFDPGMVHFQSTYVIAHEMAHGYGVTNEADCNFIALLTCLNTPNDYIQYSGLLTYWRYLMNELKEKARFSFYKAAYHRPMGVRQDIKALYDALDQYPDVLPALRDIIYDSYLKSNGVNDGLKSYNKVIDLVFAYKMKTGRSVYLPK